MNVVIFPIQKKKKKVFQHPKKQGGEKAPALTFWFMEDADSETNRTSSVKAKHLHLIYKHQAGNLI